MSDQASSGIDQDEPQANTDMATDDMMTNDEAGADPAQSDAADQAVEELDPEQRIVQLESDLEVARDRMLRLAADLENTRRRAQKEKSEASQYALTNFARDLLSVADNFQRALETAPEDPGEASREVLSGVINGIRMTEKELITVLERNGVHQVHPAGDVFDPHLHQAIAEVPGNGEPKGHVVDVAQTGFTIGDRVLRAAMVTVSTGVGASDSDGSDSD